MGGEADWQATMPRGGCESLCTTALCFRLIGTVSLLDGIDETRWICLRVHSEDASTIVHSDKFVYWQVYS